MSIKGPQIDLPSGVRGGAEVWDIGLAGTILSSEYFDTVVTGITLDLGSSLITFVGRASQNALSQGLSQSSIGFNSRQLSNDQLFSLTSSVLKWAARSVDVSGAGSIDLNAANFLLSALSQNNQLKNDLNSVVFNLSGRNVDSFLATPGPELVASGFKVKTTTTAFPIIIDPSNTVDGLIYLKLRVMGYRGSLNDMLYDFFESDANEIGGREHLWLVGRTGGSSGSVDDLWEKYLSSLGYSGSLQDMKKEFWINY